MFANHVGGEIDFSEWEFGGDRAFDTAVAIAAKAAIDNVFERESGVWVSCTGAADVITLSVSLDLGNSLNDPEYAVDLFAVLMEELEGQHCGTDAAPYIRPDGAAKFADVAAALRSMALKIDAEAARLLAAGAAK